MRKIDLTALAVIAVLALAAGMASATMGDYNYNYNRNISPPQYVPSATGAGPCTVCPAPVSKPACPGCGPVVTGYPASDCCNVAPMGECGAFCTAGQTAPGWPYNWCSEYWLRPNSNF